MNTNMLCNNFTEELLGLQGVKITNIENNEDNQIIYAEMERKKHNCYILECLLRLMTRKSATILSFEINPFLWSWFTAFSLGIKHKKANKKSRHTDSKNTEKVIFFSHNFMLLLCNGFEIQSYAYNWKLPERQTALSDRFSNWQSLFYTGWKKMSRKILKFFWQSVYFFFYAVILWDLHKKIQCSFLRKIRL